MSERSDVVSPGVLCPESGTHSFGISRDRNENGLEVCAKSPQLSNGWAGALKLAQNQLSEMSGTKWNETMKL